MIELKAADIAAITRGRLSIPSGADISPTSVVTDSREASAGSLYVAKRGEHADGHSFVPDAVKRGAVLVLAERAVFDAEGNAFPAVIVDDAVVAMGELAAESVRRIRERRRREGSDLTVIGVTGSAGKTTTKDLLAGVLATQAPTVAPRGSYNGEVGVPLTVFNAGFETRYLVIEMGATGVGHIRYLAEMVQPDVGIVLGVGSAHVGEFGGVENIAAAKGELIEALSATGTAILNADDDRVLRMRDRTIAQTVLFGTVGSSEPTPGSATENLVRAEQTTTSADGHPEFDLVFYGAPAERWPVSSRLIGIHHVPNLLAAASAAYVLGVDPGTIAASLSEQQAASRWRMERTERADGVTIINDAYNANPESMRAALRTLAELGQGRRTWAVLGPMLELGDDSIMQHDSIGQVVVRLNISRLIVVGSIARAMHIAAVREGSWGDESMFVEDTEEAYDVLIEQLEPGDLVLFKSSNSAGLRHLGDRIAWPTTEPATQSRSTASSDQGREQL